MRSINNLLTLINDERAVQLLADYASIDPAKLAFSLSGKVDFDLRALVEQISLRKKAASKIPSWVVKNTFFHPEGIEQCTSELVANLKSTFIQADVLIDLTAGTGVDCFALGKNAKKVYAVEADPVRAELLQHNFGEIGFHQANVFCGTAEEFLQKHPIASFPHKPVVYLDPDRRPVAGKRIAFWEDATPNIQFILSQTLPFSEAVYIKLSPMEDLDKLEKDFLGQLSELYCIGDDYELKEVLACFKPNVYSVKRLVAVAFKSGRNWMKEVPVRLEYQSVGSLSGKCWVSHPAVNKSGFSDTFAAEAGMFPLYTNGVYFTGDRFPDAPGSRLQLLDAGDFKVDHIQKWLKEHAHTRINVRVREFYLKPEEVLKKLKLKEGGSLHLLCYKNGSTAKYIIAENVED